MKIVFLGGTCNESKWREELIPQLNVDYFNPVIEDWDDDARIREIEAREKADFILYTITPLMTGIYSIAEAVDDSNKRSYRTIVCVLTEDNGKAFSDGQMRSINAFKEMIVRNRAKLCSTLEEVAEYINNEARKIEEHEAPMQASLDDVLKKYAEKRRGKEIYDSFDKIESDFLTTISSIHESKIKLSFKRFPAFSKELFDKFTDYKSGKYSIDFSLKESTKQKGKFIYYTQWWKSKVVESVIDRDFVIETDFGTKILCDADIFSESCNFYLNESKHPFGSIKESVTFLTPLSERNNTYNPSWIKKLNYGDIVITDINKQHKSIEFFNESMHIVLTAKKDNKSSDFWHINHE